MLNKKKIVRHIRIYTSLFKILYYIYYSNEFWIRIRGSRTILRISRLNKFFFVRDRFNRLNFNSRNLPIFLQFIEIYYFERVSVSSCFQ